MAKFQVASGTTSKLIRVIITASGVPVTSLTSASSGLLMAYIREGDASDTGVSPVTATLGTWTSGGFVVVDATKFPGVYEIGIPNAALASGKSVLYSVYGYTGMDTCLSEIEITQVNNQDGVHFGITGIPNAAAGAAGGLQIAYPIIKNTPYSNFKFYLVSSTDHVTPKTGATVAGQVAIDAAAFTSLTNAVTEVGSGWYLVNLAAADLNGTDIALKFTATGADPVNVKVPLSA